MNNYFMSNVISIVAIVAAVVMAVWGNVDPMVFNAKQLIILGGLIGLWHLIHSLRGREWSDHK